MTVAQLSPLIALIEALGGLVIVLAVLRALLLLFRSWPALGPVTVDAARQELTEGLLAGIFYKLAATLLKTLVLNDWSAIGRVFAVVLIRAFLKQALTWQQQIAKKPA